MTARDVTQLGQVFTPPEVVAYMLSLRLRQGNVLEPSAGDGAFARQIAGCLAVEFDPRVAPPGALVQDFFDFPLSEKFDTIIGNPPYVRFQDIAPETRAKLDMTLFDERSNLFLFFIHKCIQHLKPGGELIFIVPRELAKLTAAKKLNHWLAQQGSITDYRETGDDRIFGKFVPNCVIFRFEQGRLGANERRMHDGRQFSESHGQLLFLNGDYSVPAARVFDVRVGAVSGADNIFEHPQGEREFVCSKTAETGHLRRMFFDQQHPHLAQHKTALLTRRVKKFDESNWWKWGRLHPQTDQPRIYVNSKTRRPQPFFQHPCTDFDGAILALFPKQDGLSAKELVILTQWLNEVDWTDLGFVCDGRFLFTQRSLQTCLLPSHFAEFSIKGDEHGRKLGLPA